LFALGGFVIYCIIEICFKIKYKILVSMFLGMLMACFDELHQLYSKNRGPQIEDVWLDTIGVVSGIGIAICCVSISKKIYNRFKKGSKIYDKLQKNNRRKNCKNN